MTAASELQQLTELEDGWNGKDSFAPLPEVVANCWALVSIWNRPDTDVTPSENGTVTFEWPGAYLAVGTTKFSMWNETHFINGEMKLRQVSA